jgi:hypothetical protein
MTKTFTIVKTRKGRKTEITNTLPELIKYFSYTLEVGHSYNPKIKLQPTTIRSFISNMEKSLDEKEGSCYERTEIGTVTL